nr:MAG TPA: hypothetical protein [Caudoviricetes sp.]
MVTLQELVNNLDSGVYGDYEVRIENLGELYKVVQTASNYKAGLASFDETKHAIVEAVNNGLFGDANEVPETLGEWYLEFFA